MPIQEDLWLAVMGEQEQAVEEVIMEVEVVVDAAEAVEVADVVVEVAADRVD